MVRVTPAASRSREARPGLSRGIDLRGKHRGRSAERRAVPAGIASAPEASSDGNVCGCGVDNGWMRLSALCLPFFLAQEANLFFRAQCLGCGRIARTGLFAPLHGGRMNNGKKKSSGWRPSGKRRTPAEHQARYFARQGAAAQHESERLGRWRSCPARRCRRLGRCDSEELQCERRPRPAAAGPCSAAPNASDAARAAAPEPEPEPERKTAPVISAAEAAAAIKASIAAEPPDAFNRDDLEALKRAGLI